MNSTKYRARRDAIRNAMWSVYDNLPKTDDREEDKKQRKIVHRRWCRALLRLVGTQMSAASCSEHGMSMIYLPYTVKQIKESNDEYLNDLPLSKWDSAAGRLIRQGLVSSLSDGVCILKELARIRAGI